MEKNENNEIMTIENGDNNIFKIYYSYVNEFMYLYTFVDNIKTVFYKIPIKEYNDNETLALDKMREFCCLLPKEVKISNRKINTINILEYLNWFIDKKYAEKLLEKLNFKSVYGDYINLLDLFKRLNILIDNLNIGNIKNFYDTKFGIYKIIETL